MYVKVLIDDSRFFLHLRFVILCCCCVPKLITYAFCSMNPSQGFWIENNFSKCGFLTLLVILFKILNILVELCFSLKPLEKENFTPIKWVIVGKKFLPLESEIYILQKLVLLIISTEKCGPKTRFHNMVKLCFQFYV